MKKLFGLLFLCVSAVASAQTVGIIDKGLRYCESTYPYDGGLLVASFGTEQLNPLNTEGKGYIMYFKDGKGSVMINADGNLSAPKGMFERNGYLYICDVNKIVVYDLNHEGAAPKTIAMPEGNLFVNDLAACCNYLYVSVTNTDMIFRIDISDPANPGEPEAWAEVKGPNGLLINNGKMYVASYPADGVTKEDNVIYRIDDLKNPVPVRFTELQGQYDGIALSSDGKYMYVTNWVPAGLSRIDMENGKVSAYDIRLDKALVGPADISVDNGFIYIPDLPNSRVVVVKE